MQAHMGQSVGGRRRGDTPRPQNGGLLRAMRYLGNQKRSVTLAYGALIIATLAQLAVPELVQRMIDAVAHGALANTILGLPAPFQDAAAARAGETLDQLRLDQASAASLLINAALIIVAFAIMRGVFSFVQADRKSVV